MALGPGTSRHIHPRTITARQEWGERGLKGETLPPCTAASLLLCRGPPAGIRKPQATPTSPRHRSPRPAAEEEEEHAEGPA